MIGQLIQVTVRTTTRHLRPGTARDIAEKYVVPAIDAAVLFWCWIGGEGDHADSAE